MISRDQRCQRWDYLSGSQQTGQRREQWIVPLLLNAQQANGLPPDLDSRQSVTRNIQHVKKLYILVLCDTHPILTNIYLVLCDTHPILIDFNLVLCDIHLIITDFNLVLCDTHLILINFALWLCHKALLLPVCTYGNSSLDHLTKVWVDRRTTHRLNTLQLTGSRYVKPLPNSKTSVRLSFSSHHITNRPLHYKRGDKEPSTSKESVNNNN